MNKIQIEYKSEKVADPAEFSKLLDNIRLMFEKTKETSDIKIVATVTEKKPERAEAVLFVPSGIEATEPPAPAEAPAPEAPVLVQTPLTAVKKKRRNKAEMAAWRASKATPAVHPEHKAANDAEGVVETEAERIARISQDMNALAPAVDKVVVAVKEPIPPTPALDYNAHYMSSVNEYMASETDPDPMQTVANIANEVCGTTNPNTMTLSDKRSILEMLDLPVEPVGG